MWWNEKYGKNSICAITQMRLRPGKNRNGMSYSIFLDCKHGFYRSALLNWIVSRPYEEPTCPLCRTSFDPIVALT